MPKHCLFLRELSSGSAAARCGRRDARDTCVKLGTSRYLVANYKTERKVITRAATKWNLDNETKLMEMIEQISFFSSPNDAFTFERTLCNNTFEESLVR